MELQAAEAARQRLTDELARIREERYAASEAEAEDVKAFTLLEKNVKKELIEEKKEKEEVGEAEVLLLKKTQEELVEILLAETHFIKKNLYENAFDGVQLSEKQEETKIYSLLYKKAKEVTEEAQQSLINIVKDVKKELIEEKEEVGEAQEEVREAKELPLLKKVQEKILKAYAKVGEAQVLLVEVEAYTVESIYNANQQFVLSVIETICFIYYFYKENSLPIPEQTEPSEELGDERFGTSITAVEVSKQNDKYKKQKTEWTNLYEKRREKMEELASLYAELDKSEVEEREKYIENLDNQISEIQYEYSDEFINDLFFKCLNYTLVLQDFNNLIEDSVIGLLTVIQDPVIRLLKAILTVCKEEFEDDFIEIVCNILQHIYSKDPTYNDFDFNQIWVPNYVEEWWNKRF